MAPTESKEFLEEFINGYREHRILWDTAHRNYQNKPKRSIAYENLLVIMQKYRSDATLAEVKRKINTLRSTFRKELRKIKESEPLGAVDEDDIYQPTVWWFELMSFLSDLEKPVETSAIVGEVSEIESKCPIPMPVADPLPPKKIKETVPKGLVRRKYVSQGHRSKKDDEKFTSIAKVWAEKLKTLSYKRQLIVEKKINDIFFEEQMTDALSSEDEQGQQSEKVMLLPSCTSSRYSSTDSFPSTSRHRLSPLTTSFKLGTSQQFPTDAVELQKFYEQPIKVENLNQ